MSSWSHCDSNLGYLPFFTISSVLILKFLIYFNRPQYFSYRNLNSIHSNNLNFLLYINKILSGLDHL